MNFSIIIVSLNAGNDLQDTVDSILNQDYGNFEIIIKDGISKDGSIEHLRKDDRVRVVQKNDSGIYDAMNQAIEYVTGDYVLYLNCGDTFYSNDVLSQASMAIAKRQGLKIYYGDCYAENRKVIIKAPSKITDYVCFSRIICHQSTFYESGLLKSRKFNLNYRICADVEYYVSGYKRGGIDPLYIPLVIVSYKGGGFSETIENKKLAIKEQELILRENFKKPAYIKYFIMQFVTGVAFKKKLTTISWFQKPYSWFATNFYRFKNKLFIN